MAEHPITPPPELVAKLWREASAGRDDAPIGEIFNHGVLLAYAAGADQELEACCEWLCSSSGNYYADIAVKLRTARRPKPPTLKEQALEGFERVLSQLYSPEARKGLEAECKTILRALEALPK